MKKSLAIILVFAFVMSSANLTKICGGGYIFHNFDSEG